MTAYYVVSEALTNVAKHSGATSSSVAVRIRYDELHIEVCDNGRGGADRRRGSGLQGLEDRLAALDGRLTVRSRQGAGTVLEAVLPCR